MAIMRIAVVLTASTGGIGRHAAGLAGRLSAQGHRVDVFCPALTAQAHDFGDLPRLGLRQLPRIRDVDVVHAHGLKAGALAAAARTGSSAALVVTWHNDVSAGAVPRRGPASLAPAALQRYVARRADVTLGASSDLVALARACGARTAWLGAVAAPALPEAQRTREEVRADLGAGDEVVALTVSRLAAQKNLGLLLDVAAAVPVVTYWVAGDGPEHAALQARIETEGLPVRLLGHRSDIADLLAAADLAILTSTWEARALVAQEALLSGVPLISTRVGGLGELVGDAAVLVDPANPAEMIAAVRALAADGGRRAELAARGRERAATWPDEDAVAENVLRAYEFAQQRRSRGAR